VSAKKFARRTQNGPKSAFSGVLGELFRGSAVGGGLLGELFRGEPEKAGCWESFVAVLWSCAFPAARWCHESRQSRGAYRNSHAIPREHHAGVCQFVMLRHLCCGIACGIGGGERWWGEAGCWCVTFFALLGLVVVGAVENSPCLLKVGRKGVFRACGESFVPGDPSGSVCCESFVPAPASRAVQSSPCVACYWREREKILPACGKWAEIGVFVCAGRVLYRLGPTGLRVGRVLYRVGPTGLRAGRVLYRWRLRGVVLGIVASRLWETRGLQPGLQAAWVHPFRWYSV